MANCGALCDMQLQIEVIAIFTKTAELRNKCVALKSLGKSTHMESKVMAKIDYDSRLLPKILITIQGNLVLGTSEIWRTHTILAL